MGMKKAIAKSYAVAFVILTWQNQNHSVNWNWNRVSGLTSQAVG